jgi:hypothetical protein
VKATGLSKAWLGERVQGLIADGRLRVSPTVGSLRGTDERLMRETADGRLVEVSPRRRAPSRAARAPART